MKNTFGNSLTVTLFGESHGPAIGAVIDGMPSGVAVDNEYIASQLTRRRPKDALSTSRQEPDKYNILSGVFEGFTTGAPICITIPNEDIHSSDYDDIKFKMRPSHADFTAYCRYDGFCDYRGGGHFSGRVTAALVAAAGIIIPALHRKGICINTRILSIAGETQEEMWKEKILAAKADGDSVGGVVQTVITGVPAGVGEPWFDTVEGMLSHAIFSIPAVKGVEFGLGGDFADRTGSQVNDQMYVDDGVVKCYTNNNGGVLGGITNGMPIVFNTVIKPTPTINKEQNTVDIIEKKNTTISARGRHDPCIVHRAEVVVESVTALVVADMLLTRFGTDWLDE